MFKGDAAFPRLCSLKIVITLLLYGHPPDEVGGSAGSWTVPGKKLPKSAEAVCAKPKLSARHAKTKRDLLRAIPIILYLN
jgi:hypothetical protein